MLTNIPMGGEKTTWMLSFPQNGIVKMVQIQNWIILGSAYK